MAVNCCCQRPENNRHTRTSFTWSSRIYVPTLENECFRSSLCIVECVSTSNQCGVASLSTCSWVKGFFSVWLSLRCWDKISMLGSVLWIWRDLCIYQLLCSSSAEIYLTWSEMFVNWPVRSEDISECCTDMTYLVSYLIGSEASWYSCKWPQSMGLLHISMHISYLNHSFTFFSPFSNCDVVFSFNQWINSVLLHLRLQKCPSIQCYRLSVQRPLCQLSSPCRQPEDDPHCMLGRMGGCIVTLCYLHRPA